MEHGGKREGAGRPKGTTKAEHKKYKNITVSLLPEDYETIKNLAEKENKTISKFLVGLAIKKDT